MKKITITGLSAPVVSEVAATVMSPPISEQLFGSTEQISMSLEEHKPIEISPESIAELIEQEK